MTAAGNRIANQTGPSVGTITDSITAHAGGGQTSATALTTTFNRVTTVATAADSIKLPPSTLTPGVLGSVGTSVFVMNSGANSLQAFGAGTDTINGIATGIAQGAGLMAIYTLVAITSGGVGQWYSHLGTTISPAFTNITASGTLAVTGLTTVTGGILGTATNDNATAGNVGEIATASLAVGSAVSLTTATALDIITVSLTAGDWDVTGVVDFAPAATTNVTLLLAGASSTANTLGADDTYSSTVFLTAGQVSTNGNYRMVIPEQRFSLSATTTVRLVGQATFTASTMTAYGTVRARRVR